eukprot:jgi/Tetstr1/466438/TSEL_010966.t1
MAIANVGKQLAEEAEAEYSRLVNIGARLMQVTTLVLPTYVPNMMVSNKTLVDPKRMSWSERHTPSRVCCRAAAGLDTAAACCQGPERMSWSERRTSPPRVFAAAPQPASTRPPPVAKPASTRPQPVAKTPSAGAGPSDAPPRVFAAEPKPASTRPPPVAKTPSAEAAPSNAPTRVFAAEPQPASTRPPHVAKTPSAGAGPSDAPPRRKQSKTAEMLAKITKQKVRT